MRELVGSSRVWCIFVLVPSGLAQDFVRCPIFSYDVVQLFEGIEFNDDELKPNFKFFTNISQSEERDRIRSESNSVDWKFDL
jgi:hypothetical protein